MLFSQARPPSPPSAGACLLCVNKDALAPCSRRFCFDHRFGDTVDPSLKAGIEGLRRRPPEVRTGGITGTTERLLARTYMGRSASNEMVLRRAPGFQSCEQLANPVATTGAAIERQRGRLDPATMKPELSRWQRRQVDRSVALRARRRWEDHAFAQPDIVARRASEMRFTSGSGPTGPEAGARRDLESAALAAVAEASSSSNSSSNSYMAMGGAGQEPVGSPPNAFSPLVVRRQQPLGRNGSQGFEGKSARITAAATTAAARGQPPTAAFAAALLPRSPTSMFPPTPLPGRDDRLAAIADYDMGRSPQPTYALPQGIAAYSLQDESRQMFGLDYGGGGNSRPFTAGGGDGGGGPAPLAADDDRSNGSLDDWGALSNLSSIEQSSVWQ